MNVLKNRSLGTISVMRWRGSGPEVMDRRTTPWSENHHSSVHQSPPVISIPTYASLLDEVSALEEELRAALIDMFQVRAFEGALDDHRLSSFLQPSQHQLPQPSACR
ncbi:hypothetical protein ARMSODRAFT_1021468 [Armillaria solidipes]|uniref:Uncharacterized protein n=1 Tax=Armillaria solidipes TaxID=1076256 RepID=A0A2H3B9A8_9AGAR|nr:hypothetical protein ARMSODRAFT_1021468 [Armillaria solidipes]